MMTTSKPGELATLRRKAFKREAPSGEKGASFVLAVVDGPDAGRVFRPKTRSVSARLVELALAASDPAERKMLVDALIRAAPLPDKRPDAERLADLARGVGGVVNALSSVGRRYFAAGGRLTSSASIEIATSSPTSTPPVSSALFQFSPKSLRFSVVLT